MPYDLSIPGQLTEEELGFIEELASLVPPHGNVLELGSLFGRSSYAWAKSVDPTATVYCVDPWKREPWIAELEQSFGVPFGVATFHEHTADCTNIVAIPAYSPMHFEDWTLPIDLYFDDSVHDNPTFRQNLTLWLSRMNPGGILCGHDYTLQFPDIVKEVNELAARLDVPVRTVGAIWMIRLPDGWPGDAHGKQAHPPLVDAPIADDPAAPILPASIGSMMKRQELNLLYALTRHHFAGRGEVVDLGPFLGSSTYMLIEGLLANPVHARRNPLVFSYDMFLYEPYRGFDVFLNCKDLPTGSFFQNYVANLAHRMSYVYCSPGDMLDMGWNGNAVEILFIDLAKTPTLSNHIINKFFGALIEQHSVIVQQDYFFYDCPWIIVAMEHFANWLSFVGAAPGATAYFQSRAKIPEILLQTPVETANNPARQLRLLEQAGARHAGSNRKSIVDMARANHLLNTGDHDKARLVLNEIIVHDDDWSHDAQWNLDALRHKVGTIGA